MKQLLIMDRVLNTDNSISLQVQHILPLNDNVIPTKDIVSPQKTTFEILKNKKIEVGQLVIIKKGKETEYIGIVQDIANETTTRLSVYPLINITDTDFELKSINGNIYNWITETFTSNFVNRADKDLFMSLPFTFLDYTNGATLTLPLEDGNLFDALLSVFLKTGVYVDFSLEYISGKPTNILCSVKRASDNNKATIRYDNPIFYEKPIVEFSQAQSVNKLVLKPAEDNTAYKDTYTFYLLEDNTITQDSTNEQRLKGVVQKIVSYTDDDYTNLQTLAETELVGEAYSHQITLKMLKNEAYDFKLYDRIQYIDEKVLDNRNKVYNTYVTRIEEYENHKVVVLGALRNTLTDKIKALQKTQGSTITSSFSGGGGGGGSTIIVEDLLTSTSTTNALSANQGRVLKNLTNSAITQVVYNEQTGLFTFTRNDGTSFTVDTLMEKVVANFTYNETTQSLELTLEDGTIKSIPMTAFIDDYGGTDGAQITISISNDNKISATIKNGTITKTLLSSDLQTEIDNKAEKSAVESKNTEQDNRLTTLENNKANSADVNTKNQEQDNRLSALETDKVDKVEGKGLSTEDYTTAEKNKLAGVQAGANNYVLPQATESVLGGVKAVPKDISHRRKVGIASDGTLYSEQAFGITGTVVWKDGVDLLDWDSNSKVDVRYDMGEVQKSEVDYSRLIMTGGAYGNGKYLLVGRDYTQGTVPYCARSTDGISWESGFIRPDPKPDGYGTSPVGAVFGKGVFVVAVQGSTDYLVYSQDAVTWNVALTTSESIWRVNYANGRFIAITTGGTKLFLSEDGINWQEVNIGVDLDSKDIVFGNGLYVTENGSYSEDGINWTKGTLTHGKSITYGNGTFIIVRRNANTIYYSTDGINWETLNVTGTSITYFDYPSIAFGDGMFVIISDNGDGATYAIYSKDGRSWIDLPFENTMLGQYGDPYVLFGNHRFVCILLRSEEALYIDTLPSVPIARIILPDGTIIETNNIALLDRLSNVAKTGSYNDLIDKPTIESAENKMDKENPTGTGSFSLNRKADTTIGNYSVAEGYNTTASGNYAHAEGGYTIASGGVSHAEGDNTTASGDFSHAEGSQTTATSMGAHAEGWGTTASNVGAHAEGQRTTASSGGSHAEGLNTTASGMGSHAEGANTIASGENQHVFGQCNIEDTANTYIEIVGNGSLSSPANARTLDWSGNQWLAGSSTAQTFNAVSDQRLKENIKDYKCKKSILDLPIKEFDYKKTGTHSIGCIAQDLQKICPEIVNTNKDGYLSIQENKLVYLLLQEVKQLRAEIDKLKEV